MTKILIRHRSQISDLLAHDAFLPIVFLFWDCILDFKKLWVPMRNAGRKHSLSIVIWAHWEVQVLGMFNIDTVHCPCCWDRQSQCVFWSLKHELYPTVLVIRVYLIFPIICIFLTHYVKIKVVFTVPFSYESHPIISSLLWIPCCLLLFVVNLGYQGTRSIAFQSCWLLLSWLLKSRLGGQSHQTTICKTIINS